MHTVWMQIVLIVPNNKGFQQKYQAAEKKEKIRYRINMCHKDTLMSFVACVHP